MDSSDSPGPDYPLKLDGSLVSESFTNCLRSFLKGRSPQAPTPTLRIFQVGDRSASNIYIKSKQKQALGIGFACHLHKFPDTCSPKVLKEALEAYGQDKYTHGIIVQLPLPKSFEAHQRDILNLIPSIKDVDGLGDVNQSFLLRKTPPHHSMVPCTPMGCLLLLKAYHIPLKGAHIVVVGRSSLVGLPLGLQFLHHHGTVSFAHSHTKNLKKLIQSANITCFATGVPGLVAAKDLPRGGVLVDVGIHRNEQGRLHGDIFGWKKNQDISHLRAYTPVPKGVGPMTVFSLMFNTLKAWSILENQPLISLKDLLHESPFKNLSPETPKPDKGLTG